MIKTAIMAENKLILLLNLPVRYAYFMGRPFGFCSP